MKNRLVVVFLAAAFAAALASPAAAQSYDPSVGSGNIARSEVTAPIGQHRARAGVSNLGGPSAFAREPNWGQAPAVCRGCERR
jgi:hypothetical protein